MIQFEDYKRKIRFLSKLKEKTETGCLEYQGRCYPPPRLPYGQFFWGKIDGKERSENAHRAAWLIFKGRIPHGMFVLHKCHNPRCCNVSHLYIGNHAQNMKDRDEAGRTPIGAATYNFKSDAKLISLIMAEIMNGLTLKETGIKLLVSEQTIRRCGRRDFALGELLSKTSIARHRRAITKSRKKISAPS